MARNGSDGTYALSDTIAPATLADANELQAILDDIATALTASLAADGQTPITGQLKGLVSANPVYSFNGDANTGFGSDTADNAFIKAGGTKRVIVDGTTGVQLVGALTLDAGVVAGAALNLHGTTALTAPDKADEAVVYDASAAANRRITLEDLLKVINTLTAETAPAVDDVLGIYDTSEGAANAMTFANFLKVVNGLTEDTSPAIASDFLLSYDTSAGAAKKVKPSNLFLFNSPTIGIGYSTGAGGTVTQATNKSTGVTLNTVTGQITMNNAALAADAIVSFVLTDSAIAAGDVMVLNHVSGGTAGAYKLNARCASGSATIDVQNNYTSASSLSEAIVIGFALIKGVTS